MTEFTCTIPVAPVPKPRMTRSDTWKKRPAVMRYWTFKDELRKYLKGDLEPRFTVVFSVPMPKSWSKKEKALMDGRPHQAKPDIDNYLKAFMDAMCVDDSYVYWVCASKRWATDGSITITEHKEE